MADIPILGSFYTTANSRKFYHISGRVENGGADAGFAWRNIMPIGGTFKNLTVSLSTTPTTAVIVAIIINGVATLSLKVTPTMWAAGGTDSNGHYVTSSQEVPVSAGDTVGYMIVTDATAPDVFASVVLAT